MESNTFEIDPVGDDAAFTSTTVTSPQPAPAAVALSLAAGHLTEAGVHAHRFMSLADAARRMGISAARATRLAALMPLAPEIQSEVLAVRAGGPLLACPNGNAVRDGIHSASQFGSKGWVRSDHHQRWMRQSA